MSYFQINLLVYSSTVQSNQLDLRLLTWVGLGSGIDKNF